MRLVAFALASVLCVVVLVRGLSVRTAITDFLPRDEQTGLIEIAGELSRAPQARTVVITLSASDPESHQRAARDVAEQLRMSREFAWVRGGLSSGDEEALFRLFFPARIGLLELPSAGPVSEAWLDARLEALRERLAGPLGVVERRLAPEDPLGALAALRARQARARGRMRLEGGQLVTEDGRTSVLFASTLASPFDGAAQSRVERVMSDVQAALRRRDAEVELSWSGVNRYALAGERSVRADIERISTLSLAGIFLLYLVVFRSLREPVLVLLPIAFGCLLATAACQLVFGFVHGLALAFGSSIIGVAEDYSTHYFAHRLAAPKSEDNEQLMRRLWPGMLLGGISTIAGIAMLLASGFPGLQQMAAFGALGVLGALLTTRYVLPSLSRREPRPARARGRGWAERLVSHIESEPRSALWLVAPALILMAVGLPRIHFVDAVSALRTPAPEVEREDRRIQARLGQRAAGRVIVALGASDEQALARSEEVRARLLAAQAEGTVRSFQSVVELVPSVSLQRSRRAQLRDDPRFLPRFHEALARAGFVSSAFVPFEQALARDEPPLTPAALLASPLADLIAPFRAPIRHGIAYLTPVEPARGVDVAALVAGLEGVHYLDQEAVFSAAYGRFRTRALGMVAVGLVLVLLTLVARYRSLRVSALGMLPALLGAGAALGVEALRGVPANLMHVIALLLVLSMGVDYGIYALESRESVEEGATTLGSVLLAAFTTVLSFGLLGLSDNPALAAIGSTVGLGMVFTVLASPVVLALSRPKTEETR